MNLKRLVYFLCILLISFVVTVPLESCKPSYRNFRKISKKKRIKIKRYKYAKTHRKKISKHPVPINTKYIIKTQRRSSYNF